MFDSQSMPEPLAWALRPKTLAEVIGQSHLLDPGQPLNLAFASGKAHSMILWGPPGVGKTTLARLTAAAFDCEWIALSAVFSGVKEIRQALDCADRYRALKRHTILFIDEIHRFNKAQQDSLLPYTESGVISCIGATTENPAFEINSALLSRSQVYVLTPLTDQDLQKLFLRAHAQALQHLSFDPDAVDVLIAHADGDARRFLNLLEQASCAASVLNIEHVQLSWLQKTLTMPVHKFDKSGDYFYDQISAFHKSVRGSNPDAALYWLCRMLDGGMDPKYLARRIVRIAWEDIGLADPRAMQIVNDAASTYDRLGSPEGELALAQAALYLAVAPKSNAGYLAYKQAQGYVKKDRSRDVPLHLRNLKTSLKKILNSTKGYRYAHDEPHAFAAGESYLPDGMQDQHWYQPSDRGLERKIADKMSFLRALDREHDSLYGSNLSG